MLGKWKNIAFIYIRINVIKYQPTGLGETLGNILGKGIRVIVYECLENEEK